MTKRRWERPHGPDIGMVVAGALLGFCALFALSLTVALITAGGTVRTWVSAAIVYVFVAAVVLVGWRVYRTGVYVSETAVRLRYLLRTRTLRWSEVDQVTSRPARLWGRDTVRHAIWVLPHGRPPLEAPVQLADELATTGLRKKGARVLGPIQYEETLALLRRRTAAAAATGDAAPRPRPARS